MAKGRPRKKSPKQALEDDILSTGRPRGCGPEWWDKCNATPEGAKALADAQARGRQLISGGYGSIEPDEYGDWGPFLDGVSAAE